MSVLYEKISFPSGSSIRARDINRQHFTFPLHLHDELELNYILDSYGTRFAGDSVEYFQSGDFVLLGSQLPHTWQNHEKFYANRSTLNVKAISIQFGTNFIDLTASYPELMHISEMLKKSTRGIAFGNTAVQQNHELLVSLPKLEGFKKMIKFLELLDNLVKTSDYRFLASSSFADIKTDQSFKRITDTLEFISNNYQHQLSLDELSSRFHMSKSSFCNYFKRKTGKTVINYINELRISHACKLLTQSDKNILEIAYECGFNNISNFNRTFKTIIGKPPREYRKLWSGSMV